VVAALAIFLLVKAGQLSLSPGAGASGSIDGDLNVFVLGILGVISGLVSDRAIERISAAGIALLRTHSEYQPRGIQSKVLEKSASSLSDNQDPSASTPLEPRHSEDRRVATSQSKAVEKSAFPSDAKPKNGAITKGLKVRSATNNLATRSPLPLAPCEETSLPRK
jgi:hypothetical protein